MQWEPGEDAALGLALAYRQAGDRAGFAKVVATYRDRFERVAQLVPGHEAHLQERRAVVETPTASTPRALTTIEASAPRREAVAPTETEETPRASGEGGNLAPAWKLLNLGRPQEAARAFDSVLRGSSGKTRDEAAYGKSLALAAAGETVPAGFAAAEGRLGPDQRNTLGLIILERRAWDAYGAGRCAEALQWADRRDAFAQETRELLQMRVDCLTRLGRAEDAHRIQSQLDAQLAPQ